MYESINKAFNLHRGAFTHYAEQRSLNKQIFKSYGAIKAATRYSLFNGSYYNAYKRPIKTYPQTAHKERIRMEARFDQKKTKFT